MIRKIKNLFIKCSKLNQSFIKYFIKNILKTNEYYIFEYIFSHKNIEQHIKSIQINSNISKKFTVDVLNEKLMNKFRKFIIANTWHNNFDFIENRILENNICYIGFIEEEIVGYIWVKYGPGYFNYDKYFHILSKNETYTYDACVSKAYRGYNIINSIKYYAFKKSEIKYHDRSFCIIKFDNYSSIRAAIKFGYSIKEKFHIFNIYKTNIIVIR